MLKENTMYRANWKRMFAEADVGFPMLLQHFLNGSEYIFFQREYIKRTVHYSVLDGTPAISEEIGYDFFGIFGGGVARPLRFPHILVSDLFEVGHMIEVTEMSEVAKAYLLGLKCPTETEFEELIKDLI
jgi:hypothetical protein